MQIEIRSVPNESEAFRLAGEGYYPLGFGSTEAALSCSSIYREHFGERRDDPRFVVKGPATAASTFNVASLAGLLPHPNRAAEARSLSEFDRAVMVDDYRLLAELIDRTPSSLTWTMFDKIRTGSEISPHRLREAIYGEYLLVWHDMQSKAHDDVLDWYQGVCNWRNILFCQVPSDLTMAAGAKEAHYQRYEKGRKIVQQGRWVSIIQHIDPCFDDFFANTLAPVIVFWGVLTNQLIVRACDAYTAAALFGAGGLLTVRPHLHPRGWIGNDYIAWGPGGVTVTQHDVEEVARTVEECVLI